MKYIIMWPVANISRVLLTVYIMLFNILYMTLYFMWHFKLYEMTAVDKSFTLNWWKSSKFDIMNKYARTKQYNEKMVWDNYLDYIWNRPPNDRKQ